MNARRQWLALGGAIAVTAVVAWELVRVPARMQPGRERIEVGPGRAAAEIGLSRSRPARRGRNANDTVTMAERPRGLTATIEDALRELRELDTADEATRKELLQRLAAVVTPQNARTIAAGLSAEELRTEFGTVVLRQWLSADAASAAAWLRTHAITEEQAATLGAELGGAPDRLEAVELALANSRVRQPLLRAAALAVADADPARAAELAARLPADEVRADTLQTIVYAWATSDPVTTARFVMAVNDPALRESLLAVAAKALAVTDPEAGAAWLAETVRRPELVAASAGPIVDWWAMQDPAGAAQWVAAFAPGALRLTLIESVLTTWRQSDAAAAGAWLERLPERETVLAQLAAVEAEQRKPKE